MSPLFTLLNTENYFSGNDCREISFVIRKVLMFMGQTNVSQRYISLSTRSVRWFALWPHFACISSIRWCTGLRSRNTDMRPQKAVALNLCTTWIWVLMWWDWLVKAIFHTSGCGVCAPSARFKSKAPPL